MKKVLIWGRYGNYGPDYPRNRVIESVLRELGCEVDRFLPTLSATADLEYALRRGARPDLVWVPCFRQRDLAAAARYARRQRLPLVFDPLISAYDKQVNEKHKFAAGSTQARKLLQWESRLFRLPDWLIADTAGHADYFHATHGVARERIRVIPVGAEEALFTPQPWPQKPDDAPLELAFFGTFIGLQGVERAGPRHPAVRRTTHPLAPDRRRPDEGRMRTPARAARRHRGPEPGQLRGLGTAARAPRAACQRRRHPRHLRHQRQGAAGDPEQGVPGAGDRARGGHCGDASLPAGVASG
ncbi:glycosyltransferase [Thauera phenylacetica]